MRRDIAVLLGKNAVVSVTLPVAGAVEAVAVSGEAPAVDSRKTETGSTYSQKELQSIPTTRDPWAILRQVPGILLANMNVGGDESSAQSAFVGKGSHQDQNTYNLDGVAITQTVGGTPVYFDFDSLDSIEIATGGSDPSLATPGVTLNLVTKRGTNQLLGSARVLYTGGGSWDYGVEAGGPLWKDDLWIWGAGAHNSFRGQTFVLPTGEAVEQTPTLEHWNAKLNAQLGPANSFAFSYLHSNKLVRGQGAAPDRSQPSTEDVTFPTAAYRLEDSQVLSAKLFASLYLSYLSSVFTTTPEGGPDEQADFDMDYVWRNSFRIYRSARPQHQAGLTGSSFFDTGDVRHELKFGFGYKHTLTNSATSWPGGGILGSEPFQEAGITRDTAFKYEVNYYDAYVGDIAQAGNLTVNVGARFDYQQGKNLPSAAAANFIFPDILPAAQYSGDSGYRITWRQFQPRVGAMYAVGRGRKTLLRASYSRFADQLGSEVRLINAFPGAAYLYYGWNDANGDHRVQRSEVDLDDLRSAYGVDPNNPGVAASVHQIVKSLKTPTTDEFIVGVDRQILSDLSASFAYTYRIFRNPEFYRLAGTSSGSYRYIGNAAGTATASDGFVLKFNEPYYGLTTCPPPCVGVDLENRPDYKETYSGVELQLVKRLSRHWVLRAGFAYNDWQQHVSPGAVVDPNNMEGGSNASGPVVEGVGTKFGTVFINSKWQFNVNGMVQLPLGIETSANFFGRQGFPIVYVVQAFTHDLIDNTPNIQIGQVGAHRLPDVFELDLHVEKLFRIGTEVTVSPSIDCFNVANSHTVLQRNGFIGTYDPDRGTPFRQSDHFNAAAQLLSNRIFRGGVRISF